MGYSSNLRSSMSSEMTSPLDQDFVAHHCPAPHNSESGNESICPGLTTANVRQRRLISLYSKLTNTPEPDVNSMTYGEAAQYHAWLWHNWMAMGAPVGTDGSYV